MLAKRKGNGGDKSKFSRSIIIKSRVRYKSACHQLEEGALHVFDSGSSVVTE